MDLAVFTRGQLIDRDDNPPEDTVGPNHADLEARCGLGSCRLSLDHAAAVRGIPVRDEKEWKRIWDWGLLHDPTLPRSGGASR